LINRFAGSFYSGARTPEIINTLKRKHCLRMTSNFQRDPTLLTGYDLNLSADRFAKAWLSKTNERERIKANMYLLGVVDASEGTAWCKAGLFAKYAT
jgi:hypothetical protein